MLDEPIPEDYGYEKKIYSNDEALAAFQIDFENLMNKHEAKFKGVIHFVGPSWEASAAETFDDIIETEGPNPDLN